MTKSRFSDVSTRIARFGIVFVLASLARWCTAQQIRIAGAGTMPASAAISGVDVLTRSYDIARSGSNSRETLLTPDAVAAHGLSKLFSLNVMGDASHPDDPRLEAQPLIVTGIRMSDGQTHDVVYLCTMRNNLWAFDANTGQKIWPAPVSLGRPIKPKLTPVPEFPTRSEIDLWGINIQWGVLSTPVIDRESQTMYVVNWTSPTGAIADAFYQLHALNLSDGKEHEHSPVRIEATSSIAGQFSAEFKPSKQKQRSALLLLPPENSNMRPENAPVILSGGHGDEGVMAPGSTTVPANTLILACGQFGENATGQHGWLLAFDTITLRQTAAFVTTPTTGGGGIWQAGQGPAADRGGNIYVATSNGGWDGQHDFAESILMLHYTPPTTAGGTGSFQLRTWFTPFRDADREAQEPGTGYDFQDQDLGSAGPVVPSGLGLVFEAGKDGVLYVLEKGSFGNTTKEQIDGHTQFGALKSAPIFFTYFHGFGADATDLQTLDRNFGGQTHHLHGSPVFWNSPDFGSMLFCWGENESLRAWTTDSTGKVAFRAKGHEISAAGVPGLGGMPGGMLSLSANGTIKHSGIVWTTAPIDRDGNRFVAEGILRAYDASEFTSSPNSTDPVINLLWDSKRIPGNTFDYDKFCPPVVANGKVYVTTYDGRVDVYGLGK